jgi:hypothetical protein
MLRNVFVYCTLTSLPLFTLVALSQFKLVSPTVFVISIFTYGAVYHPIISGLRLYALKKIRFYQVFLMMLPWYFIKHLDDLFSPNSKKAV